MGGIVIFGAGGRAGRAVTAEARRRGHRVTAAVREPGGYGDLVADGVTLVRGDVTDVKAISAIARGHDAAVHAVSPFSGPEQGFADLDPEFFVKAADALLHGLAEAGVPRLIVIGLFANLQDAHGRPVMDDPSVFPPEIRPFALAHTAGLDRLRAADTVIDWLTLTPPALLDAAGARTGRYRVGDDTVPPSAHLSYADLAVAALDEIETPRHHRTRVSVFT
ncbi:NAD(P)H-binding protein [Sphaerisporangium sp. TRM90804]|uniref:NAD(P)-dependent oxidoreductase n=1 Tax=Sphaerisporangium sp. TRM90804 TaxID=3031113 RepID=UPI00244A1935|nr:NAD(P)H-binding protein [Sphaerisporangium sp. TRM90804]MDH2424045.1 NAD(P)H-binding protein [Sphaerisporangium sp. TRM90804]